MSTITNTKLSQITARILQQVAITHGFTSMALEAELDGAHGDLPVNPAMLAEALPAISDDLSVRLDTSDKEVRAALYYVPDLAALVYDRLHAAPHERARAVRPQHRPPSASTPTQGESAGRPA